MRVWRRTAALGAATAIATATAAFGIPGVAAAETVSTKCGGSVTAQVGDTVKASTSILGLDLGAVDLGVVKEGTTVLSKTVGVVQRLLCKVTVTVTGTADEVVKNVDKAAPEPLKRVTKPVAGAVTGTTETLRKASGATPEPAEAPTVPQRPPQQNISGGESSGTKHTPTVTVQTVRPSEHRSPAVGGSLPGAALPYTSPMDFFGGDSSLFDAAPGLRYGDTPGYAPQFGALGEGGIDDVSGQEIRNAGSARALERTQNEIGVPTLIAVLVLAGVSAGLVRTWVVRSATAGN
jgi:hypothetical protein